MSREPDTVAAPVSNSPSGYDSNKAIREAEERRREKVRLNNAAQDALVAQQKAAKAPRLRAKAAAENAAMVAIESLGVHDPLPESPEFNSIRSARENIHKSVVAAFESMARIFDNEYLDGPQAISQVAAKGREALAQHTETINSLRNGLLRTRSDVEQRLASAMTPPGHLAHMVEQARDALRVMPAKQRDEIIANAKGEESLVLLYAVGAAPAFLTGVHESQRSMKRSTLLGLRDPKLLDLEPGLPKGLAAIDKLESGLSTLVNSVADFQTARAIDDLRKA
jgi:hypothetical protein